MPPFKLLIDVLAALNTINPWIAIYVCQAHPGANDHIIIVLSFSLLAIVFLSERGFRHLDFKASIATGVALHADDGAGVTVGHDDGTVQVDTSVRVPASK